MFVHRLSVVGVVRFSSPPATHVLREAISSTLISGITSCNKGSGRSIRGVTKIGLGVGAGTVLGPGARVNVDAGFGWDLVGWRSACSSFSNFSIFVL